MTSEDIHIVIADKNSKVSDFLRRELAASGYRASVARDCKALWKLLEGPERADLLILDPEFFSSYGREPLLAHLARQLPGLPVILYAFDTEGLDYHDAKQAIAVVEKEHDTEHLKKVVAKIARRLFPERTA